MPITLQTLFEPKTRDQILEQILGVAQAVGLPIEAWQEGSVGRELMTVFAQKLADYSTVGALAAGGGLLGYATEDWLTLLAQELYLIERIPATSGTCSVTLTNSSAVAYVLAAGEVRVVNGTTGETYTSTDGGNLNALGGSLVLTVQADEPGTASNAAVGAINALVTPLLGVTVTNTSACVGTDDETDTALVARCRDSLGRASPNGPAEAYSYFAKTATRTADGTLIGVTRVNVVQGELTVTVYVADSDGPLESADLSDVNTAIQENCVPTGYTATVANATGVTVPVTCTVYLSPSSSLSIADLTSAVNERLVDYFATAPIGGYVVAGGFIFRSAIIGEVFQAAPADIIKVDLAAPAADVPLNPNQVAVLGTVTVTLGNP